MMMMMEGESSESASRNSGIKRKPNTEDDPMERAIREENRQSRLRIAQVMEQSSRNISEIIKRFRYDQNSASPERSLKLKFINNISQQVTPGEEIKGEGGVPIKVALVDCSTGEIIGFGPEAYANVEVLLLRADFAAGADSDWTSATFDESIVREVQGKKPFLDGNVNLQLKCGVVSLENVKFKHDTINIKPPEFRLGARVNNNGDRVMIKEDVTEPFKLVYYHKKYVEKHSNPLLSDKVYRLINIPRYGKTAESLRAENILTVEDFLVRLLVNAENLEEIFNLGKSKWVATVKNARACRNVDHKMYCYVNPDKTIGIVFNVLGQVLRLYMGNQLITMDMLTQVQKVNAEKLLRSCAFKNWESTVVGFSHEKSLHQYAITKMGDAPAVVAVAAATNHALDQSETAFSGTTFVGSSSAIPDMKAGDDAVATTGQFLSPFSQELSGTLSLGDISPGLTEAQLISTATGGDLEDWIKELCMSPRPPPAMVDHTSEMEQPYD